jgi:hypothetical protein
MTKLVNWLSLNKKDNGHKIVHIVNQLLRYSLLLAHFPSEVISAQLMDEEVRKLAEKAFQRTVELMEKYRDDVQRVADLLIKQETISHSDVANLIGDRKFSAGKEYDEFVATKKKINAEAAEAAEIVAEGDKGSDAQEGEPNSPSGAQVGLA